MTQPGIRQNTQCFNSTLVQLKDKTAGGYVWEYDCFNSTLVQLKVLPKIQSKPANKCFNSTLVQLKAVAVIIPACNIPVFQFYLSSIKSRRRANG